MRITCTRVYGETIRRQNLRRKEKRRTERHTVKSGSSSGIGPSAGAENRTRLRQEHPQRFEKGGFVE